MNLLRSACCIALLTLLLPPLVPVCRSGEIHLSAAASMADALKELADEYEMGHPEDRVLRNFGSSGALARQTAQGAPTDIFISANVKWMDLLIQEGVIPPGSARPFAANSLVFVGAPTVTAPTFAALASLSLIAVGSPQSVPAGQYAEQAMRAAGIYDALIDGRKLVMAKDVRQALLYVDRGEVDGAFVYATDARLAAHARVLFTVPAALHDPIICPAGLTGKGAGNAAATRFFASLFDGKADATLQKFGFARPASVANP